MLSQAAAFRLLAKIFVLAALLIPYVAAGEVTPVEISQVSTEPEVLEADKSVTVYYRNSAKNGDVFLHYGFNGWNYRTRGLGSGSEVIEGNTNYYIREKMTYVPATGQYQHTFHIPDGAKALHFVFCWDKCANGSWDNNLEKDYNRPIQFPYIGPILTWNQVTRPDTGIVVSFEHPGNVGATGDGWIRYWQAGRGAKKVSSQSKSSMHRFQMTDLKPNTRYYYQVGVGSSFVSRTYSFKTLRENSTLDSLSFLVFGDAQDDGETGRFSAVARTMADEHADADFVVSTGDLPWNDMPGDWWSFFDKGRGLFASKVLMPSLGNHDTPGNGSNSNHESFNYYFAHPGSVDHRAYYRFDVGSASFFAMNSERPSELRTNGVQYLWLQRQMKIQRAAQRSLTPVTWNFAYWHIPPFNAGIRHWQEQFTFRGVSGLFNRSLDWHFGGHEHLYQRMKPLESRSSGPVCTSDYGTEAGQGTGYLIIPSGGVTPEGQLVPANQSSQSNQIRSTLAFPDVASSINRVEAFSGFTRVDISGLSITLRTFSVDRGRATVADEVRYTKTSGF